MADNNITPLSGSDTGQEDQKQYELKVTGTGSLAAALVALAQGRDQVLVKATAFTLGEGWSLTDMIKRGEVIVTHNKHETFTLDGVPMVEFYPHEIIMRADVLEITQKYRKLYSNKGLH